MERNSPVKRPPHSMFSATFFVEAMSMCQYIVGFAIGGLAMDDCSCGRKISHGPCVAAVAHVLHSDQNGPGGVFGVQKSLLPFQRELSVAVMADKEKPLSTFGACTVTQGQAQHK
jgi:hypothetical protein